MNIGNMSTDKIRRRRNIFGITSLILLAAAMAFIFGLIKIPSMELWVDANKDVQLIIWISWAVVVIYWDNYRQFFKSRKKQNECAEQKGECTDDCKCNHSEN